MATFPILAPPPVEPVRRLAMRLPEAAAALAVSSKTLSAWTRAGLVPHVKIGGTLLYPTAALEQWLRERIEEQRAEGRAERSA